MEQWEGKRQYELSNHLGDVLTTISDKKLLLTSDELFTDGTPRDDYSLIKTYQPEVVSIDDQTQSRLDKGIGQVANLIQGKKK
jgi:hypothetical protein